MLSFGNKLNIIKSKPTGPFCTFSTSATQRVTVKSRSRAEEQICVGVQTTSAPGRGDCPRGQPGTCPRFRLSSEAGRDTEPIPPEGSGEMEWAAEEKRRERRCTGSSFVSLWHPRRPRRALKGGKGADEQKGKKRAF